MKVVPSFSRVGTQNLSSMLGLVVLIGLKNFFCVLKSSFLLLTQKKRSKRKRSLAGALVVRDSEVEVTRNVKCAG